MNPSVFVVEQDYVLPPTFISLIRLFIKADEWGNAQEKGKPPKPKVDAEVLAVAKDVLERRLGLYPTTLEVRAFLILNSRNNLQHMFRMTRSH